jgi:hypothetical protein
MSENTDAEYSPTVAKLITLGDVRGKSRWLDYGDLGISTEQIPDLIKMLGDQALRWADSATDEVWSPVHAWRALGQLRAEESIETLIGLLREIDEDEDDWVRDEIPIILGMIGPVAILPLKSYLLDSEHGLFARIAAGYSLSEIGQRHPDSRSDCVESLQEGLKDFKRNDDSLNGFLISYLADLKAVEAAPLVEEVYQADRVDISILGDYEDFKIGIGLLEKRITPPIKFIWAQEDPMVAWQDELKTQRRVNRRRQQLEKKEKQKRKIAKKTRRGNRKKKRK